MRYRKHRPATPLALAAILCALALAACGQKPEDTEPVPDRLALTIDGSPAPAHAAVYLAEASGYFDDAGLEVTITAGAGPDLDRVAAGDVDLAIVHQPDLLAARERDLDVVAVAALVHEPLASLVSLTTATITGPADLAGRRVATAGIAWQHAYLATILEQAGVAPGRVRHLEAGDDLLRPLLTRRADAVLGAGWNEEAVELRSRGRSPLAMPVDRLGVPTYDELVLVTSGRRVEEDPDPVRIFLEALARGTRAAAEDPDLAARALAAASPGADRSRLRSQIQATLPALLGPGDGPPGEMDAEEWSEYAGWMRDAGLLTREVSAPEARTNALLPGRGLED